MQEFIHKTKNSVTVRRIGIIAAWIVGLGFVMNGSSFQYNQSTLSFKDNGILLSVMIVSTVTMLPIVGSLSLWGKHRQHLKAIAFICLQLIVISCLVTGLGRNNPAPYKYVTSTLVIIESILVWKIYAASRDWTKYLQSQRTALYELHSKNSLYASGVVALISIPLCVVVAGSNWLLVWSAGILTLSIATWAIRHRSSVSSTTLHDVAPNSRLFLKALFLTSSIIWLSILGLTINYFASPDFIQAGKNDLLQVPQFGDAKITQEAQVKFVAKKFNENTQIIGGDIYLCLSGIYAHSGPPNLAHEQPILSINKTNGHDGLSPSVIKFSASDLAVASSCSSGSLQYVSRDIELPGSRNSAASYYPNDHYYFAMYASLAVPGHDIATPQIDVDTSEIAGMRFAQSQIGNWGSNSVKLFTLLREPDLILFSYMIVAAPLTILLIIASLVLFGAKLNPKTNGYVFGIGLVVLTILPMRSVLVPQNISGFTSIDLLLGLELATSALLMTLYYIRERAEQLATKSRLLNTQH